MSKILDTIHNVRDLDKIPKKDLKILASEIREFIVNSVANSGGHLASSLGVVELTLALHYVFQSPDDKIIWDVGHQSYVHKILTGRKDQFHTIRQLNGISGFPKYSESEHDQFDVGHSSTSLSVGIGFACARDLANKNHHIISVIGDGALTGGIALEALSNIGYQKSRMIIILNDNQMSIDNNVGAFSEYSPKLAQNKVYKATKEYVKTILNKESYSTQAISTIKRHVKQVISPNYFLEKMGISYTGPIDGHDILVLIKILENAKKYRKPILIHAKTEKGRGYVFAEKHKTKFHGIGKFNKENGEILKIKKRSYSQIFGEEVCKLAKKNKQIIAITAAMPHGVGLDKFKKLYPDRFFDVGIAEQHAVTFAAGLARRGFIPIVAIYSTFLQRAYDQIMHDVCLQNLGVIFMIDRAGIVGEDGPTHHGLFDISFLRHMPNMIIAAPSNEEDFKNIFQKAISAQKPFAIRYPKGECIKNLYTPAESKNKKILKKIPKSKNLFKDKKLLIIAVGSMVAPAIRAAEIFNTENENVIVVVDAVFIKPLDREILKYIKKIKNVLVIEEHTLLGGFGSLILEKLNKEKQEANVTCIGIADEFITHGKREELLQKLGLDEKGILKKIRKILSGS